MMHDTAGQRARTALCVGIDTYDRAPLRGAVRDAERWARTLEARGFATRLLRDREATRERILHEMGTLIGEAVAGDLVAIVFAGHGTQHVGEGTDPTEAEGSSGGGGWWRPTRQLARSDVTTAIVPVDVEEGGLILDDEIGEIMSLIPRGVLVTGFFDCCHAGTITRDSAKPDGSRRRGAIRPRHLEPDDTMREAFARLLQRRRTLRGTLCRRRLRSPLTMREVCVSACGDDEVAFEVGGAGLFSAAATEVLQELPRRHWSNAAFVREVERRMQRVLDQRPRLSCAPWRKRERVLGERLAA